MDIFHSVLYSWIILGLITFVLLQKVTAPFGRHTASTWGWMINARLAWFIMEIPSPIFLLLFFYLSDGKLNTLMAYFLLLWTAHYFNRSFIYPLRQKDHEKKMPLLIMLFAIFFNLINGYLNGSYFGTNWMSYPENWSSSIYFITGNVLFFTGMIINIQSDNILLALRSPGEKTYHLPKGGLFKYISCPNLFGEIIEWTGFALMTCSPAAVSFAVWTFCNLAPRAIAHHKWYQNKFEDYPRNRKALIPFVW